MACRQPAKKLKRMADQELIRHLTFRCFIREFANKFANKFAVLSDSSASVTFNAGHISRDGSICNAMVKVSWTPLRVSGGKIGWWVRRLL